MGWKRKVKGKVLGEEQTKRKAKYFWNNRTKYLGAKRMGGAPDIRDNSARREKKKKTHHADKKERKSTS